MTRTLPDHRDCTTHSNYSLSCEDYEGLLTACGSKCQLCGFPSAEMPYQRLYIDHHAYLGKWAVRGLLCIRCNTAISDRRIEVKPEGMSEYLENPWFKRMLAERGISDDPTVEPPADAVIENQFRVRWAHNDDGKWIASRKYNNGHPYKPRRWLEMFQDYGPHNLRVVPPEELKARPVTVALKRATATIRIDNAESAARTLRRRMPPALRAALARLLLEDEPMSSETTEGEA